jgi:hypothetical protein
MTGMLNLLLKHPDPQAYLPIVRLICLSVLDDVNPLPFVKRACR